MHLPSEPAAACAVAGSAQASFMLAETYDPAILSTWGTYGTRGDASKAREVLGWKPRVGFSELVRMMYEHDLTTEQIKAAGVRRS